MRLISPASTSFPMPFPGTPASLAMMERWDLRCRTNSSSSRSGAPTPMNPPIMTLAPSGILATASSTGTTLIIRSSAELEAGKDPDTSVQDALGGERRVDLHQDAMIVGSSCWESRRKKYLKPIFTSPAVAGANDFEARSAVGSFRKIPEYPHRKAAKA